MAFARAARFPVQVPGRDFSTPGPGTYSPRASCGLPRVLVYTFGQPSPPKPRPLPKAKAVAIVNDAQPQQTTQLATPRLQQDEALPSVDVAQLALTTHLGRGGLGTVQTGVFRGTAIAVKYYRHQPHLFSNPAEDRRALHKEAMLLTRIDHPNVVRVLCLVADNGDTTGFGMEMLGKSLQEAHNKRELNGRVLAEAFSPTCQGVAHIHGLLVAHLDIKPANLCFARPMSNDIKLIDFDAAQELKQADEVLDRLPGNLLAVSPERADKQPCRALAEDAYMTGYTFLTLLGQTPANRETGRLQRWVMSLLSPVEKRPSMQQILEQCTKPMEDEPDPTDALPALLLVKPEAVPAAGEAVFTKLLGSELC